MSAPLYRTLGHPRFKKKVSHVFVSALGLPCPDGRESKDPGGKICDCSVSSAPWAPQGVAAPAGHQRLARHLLEGRALQFWQPALEGVTTAARSRCVSRVSDCPGERAVGLLETELTRCLDVVRALEQPGVQGLGCPCQRASHPRPRPVKLYCSQPVVHFRFRQIVCT